MYFFPLEGGLMGPTKSKAHFSNGSRCTRVELGNLFEDFETDLLITLGNKINTLKKKKRQDEQ